MAARTAAALQRRRGCAAPLEGRVRAMIGILRWHPDHVAATVHLDDDAQAAHLLAEMRSACPEWPEVLGYEDADLAEADAFRVAAQSSLPPGSLAHLAAAATAHPLALQGPRGWPQLVTLLVLRALATIPTGSLTSLPVPFARDKLAQALRLRPELVSRHLTTLRERPRRWIEVVREHSFAERRARLYRVHVAPILAAADVDRATVEATAAAYRERAIDAIREAVDAGIDADFASFAVVE